MDESGKSSIFLGNYPQVDDFPSSSPSKKYSISNSVNGSGGGWWVGFLEDHPWQVNASRGMRFFVVPSVHLSFLSYLSDALYVTFHFVIVTDKQ